MSGRPIHVWPEGVPERFDKDFERLLALAKENADPPPWHQQFRLSVPEGTTLFQAVNKHFGHGQCPERRLIEKRLLLSWLMDPEPRMVTRADFDKPVRDWMRLAFFRERIDRVNGFKRSYKRWVIFTKPFDYTAKRPVRAIPNLGKNSRRIK